MSEQGTRKTIIIDSQGWIFVDGVKIGRCEKGGDGVIHFFDKDRRRSAQRGTDQVECHIRELARVIEDGSSNGSWTY